MVDTSHLSLRANSLIVSVGAVARLVVSLISIPLLVRFLGLERYGVWVVLNSVILIAGLMELGLSMALTNYLSADYARQDWLSANQSVTTSFVLVTCLGGLTSVGLWLAHPLVVRALFLEDSHRVEALFALGVISWLVLLRFWQQWAMAAEAALFRYDIQAAVETVSAIIMQIGVMLFALVGSSLWVLAAWSLVVTGGSVIVHCLALRRLFYGRFLRFRYSRQIANVLLRFGATQWLANLGATLFGYGDRIIINLFFGSGVTGLYSAATSIAIQINTLSAFPLRVLPPAISAAKALSQYSRIRQIFIRSTRLNGLLVVLISAPIFFWAPQLSSLLVGTEYATLTAEILRTIAFAYGLYSLGAAGFFSALGVGFPKLNAQWGIMGSLFSLSIMVVLAICVGLKGAVWGNIGYALVLIINFKLIKIIDLDYRTYLKTFYPSIITVFVWWLLSIYVNIDILPIWALTPLFFLLVISSIVFVSGVIFLQYIIDMVFEIYKTGILPKISQIIKFSRRG
jgi:O-antigen/teichoic acid export membrane protein